MKIKSLLVLTAAVTFIFTSCAIEDSADVNQNKIYADYDLRYDENSDKTRVVATFRFGGATGTLLELTGNAQVTFNGEKLPFRPLYGGHTMEFAGEVNGGTFVYTNVEGTVFTNTTPQYEFIGYPADLDTISKSSAYELTWMGNPLNTDQRAALFIGSWKWGEDALFVEPGLGATKLILGKDQLKNVATGASTLFMDRTTVRDITDGTPEGGRIRASYRPANITVQIVE